MTLKIALQMDPVDQVKIDADTTFHIGLEAQRRGYSLFFYTPDNLAYMEGRIIARGFPIELRRDKANHVSYGPEEVVDLAEFDVVWLRQDPPFDMAYITSTHLLDLLKGQTVVVNDPFWVRNLPEKLFVLQFPDLTPPTAIARDLQTIRDFREKHGDIILKPLYGAGGAGVFKLSHYDGNLVALHELFTGISREPLIVQKFVPAVTRGDKRVILIDGEPVGAINRVPLAGETRSNMHVGGRAEKIDLTERDREICARIGPPLRERGQILVGIDVIGDWLTEINVTSPTGIQELERFDGIDVVGRLWNAVEKRLKP